MRAADEHSPATTPSAFRPAQTDQAGKGQARVRASAARVEKNDAAAASGKFEHAADEVGLLVGQVAVNGQLPSAVSRFRPWPPAGRRVRDKVSGVGRGAAAFYDQPDARFFQRNGGEMLNFRRKYRQRRNRPEGVDDQLQIAEPVFVAPLLPAFSTHLQAGCRTIEATTKNEPTPHPERTCRAIIPGVVSVCGLFPASRVPTPQAKGPMIVFG